MASTDFTPNLGLCNWTAEDKPKRADFVSDNGIIDRELGGHILDSSIHLTADEKSRALSPYAAMAYSGDGSATRSLTAAFAPRLALVYRRGAAPVEYRSGGALVNSAVAYYGMSGSSGLSISSTGIVVRQDSAMTGGVQNNLNEADGQYVAILFR